MLVEDGSNTLFFAGRPVDREVAVFVYVTLARAAIQMSAKLQKVKELVRHLTDEPIDLRNFRASFYEGFVDGIRNRLAERKATFTDENPSFALVLTKSDEELQAWRKGNTVPARRPPSSGSGQTNATAYAAGKAYAKEVPIQTGVGSTRTAPKRLA